jgi:broad specificity phosphatase PhoE
MSNRGTIYLVRHGRTVMNRDVRFRGVRDVPLDEVGMREAWAIAGALAGVGLSKVYTSPLSRARHVAEAIARLAAVDEVHEEPLLVNLDYGEWEGLTREEALARDPEVFRTYANDPENAFCPGGETVRAAADRVVLALQRIAVENPGASVAVVTHGVMVRLAVLRIAGRPKSDWQFKLATGSATVFSAHGDELKLVSTSDREQPDPRKGAAELVSGVPPNAAVSDRRQLPDRRRHDHGATLAVNQRRGPRRAEEIPAKTG